MSWVGLGPDGDVVGYWRAVGDGDLHNRWLSREYLAQVFCAGPDVVGDAGWPSMGDVRTAARTKAVITRG